jgi:predicted nucleotidyltransferase
MAQNLDFSPWELRQIEKLVAEHQADFLEAWRENFGSKGR